MKENVNKILIGVIILLLIIVGVLLYFNYNNGKSNNSEITDKEVEKDDSKDTESKEETEKSEKSKALEEETKESQRKYNEFVETHTCKNTYNFLSKSKDELEDFVRNVPFEIIIENDLTYNELMNMYVAIKAIRNTTTLKSATKGFTGNDVIYDKNGVMYPDNRDELNEYYYTLNYFKDFEFTVDEYEKADKDLWKYAMNGCYQCASLESIDSFKENLINEYGTYGDMFSDSFFIKSELGYYDGELAMNFVVIYDKNINKLFTTVSGGSATNYQTAIFDTKEDGDYYTISFSTVQFEMGSYDIRLDAYNKIETGYTSSSNKSYEDIIKEYKDKVPNYEITFKLNSNNKYEFYDIKKTNNI